MLFFVLIALDELVARDGLVFGLAIGDLPDA
jgi:hypothetical protein